jgi:hypothetical protein
MPMPNATNENRERRASRQPIRRGQNRTVATALAAVALAGGLARAADEPLRAAADGMNAKIERLREAAERPPTARSSAAETSFSEGEINAYLQVYGPTFLPPGIARPQVAIAEGGRVRARAIVDLDAVRVARPRGLLDPLAFATGALEVIAAGFVEGRDGVGTVRLESATVGGIAVPRTVAEELLRFYTRTPERPGGFELDKPFPLPGTLRGVITARGTAKVAH